MANNFYYKWRISLLYNLYIIYIPSWCALCMYMCINKLKTYTCRYIGHTYTQNCGKFTVVNFTIILVAALVSVHRTTKNDHMVLFPNISNVASITFQ